LRSASLVVLATLACLVVLHWASAVFVPLVLGLMSSYALTPLVDRLVRLHIPRALAAAMLLIAIVGGVGWTANSLSADAATMIETLPDVAQKLRRGLEAWRMQGPTSTIDRVQKAAAEIERAADAGAASSAAPGQKVTKVQIERPRFNVNDYLWPSALGLAAAAGQATIVVFVTFFLLLSGDNFRRKMVKIAGPTFQQKRLTLQALDEIDQQIQRYLLVQVFTSMLVGVATGLAFLWIGVEHAAVWGVLAFALSFIPYLGSVVAIGGSALMGFVQFGSLEMALLIGGVVLIIYGIEGGLLTPWLTSRAGRMNPVVVFAGVLTWGWIWGLWGLFLGVPILMAIKTVCDRVDDLKAVGELLGE
jgi:predicted PurR-regulated permease PerM